MKTYKVRWGYKRDANAADSLYMGNNATAVRLWVKGVFQVKARSKVSASREARFFLAREFPKASAIEVWSVERR